NKIEDISNIFTKLSTLRVLNLTMNRITFVRDGTFLTNSALTELDLSENRIEWLGTGNPVVCDCRLSWLVTIASATKSRDWTICQSPLRFKNRLFYDLTADDLKAWPQGCDANCTCECHDDELFGRDIHVSCANESLSELPPTFPVETAVLDLSGNRLRELDDDLAARWPNLGSLNIADNRLTRFPTGLVSRMNLSSIWLSDNPWSCDCEDYVFTRWAGTIEAVVSSASLQQR
ncbi:unnamed protein product, partial [Ixodes hexagonus]